MSARLGASLREPSPAAAPDPRLAPGVRTAVASLTLLIATITTRLPAQSPLDRVFVGLGFGGGQVEHWSDQTAATRATTVTASLRFGIVVSTSLRLGIEANGWGLESGDVWDPSQGVTVNQTLFIAQFAPWRAKRFHLKAGIGWGEYNSNHADDHDSRAFGAVSLGAGYDVPLWRNVSLTIAADGTRGPMGSADARVTTSTGRGFRAWAVNVGARWH